jgi:hypothetical protein
VCARACARTQALAPRTHPFARCDASRPPGCCSTTHARARWRIHAPACAGIYMQRRALAHKCTGVRPPPHHCAVALDRSVAWRATQHNLSQRRATCCIESHAVTDSCGGKATPSAAAASSLPLVGLPTTSWPTPYSLAAIASDSCDRLDCKMRPHLPRDRVHPPRTSAPGPSPPQPTSAPGLSRSLLTSAPVGLLSLQSLLPAVASTSAQHKRDAAAHVLQPSATCARGIPLRTAHAASSCTLLRCRATGCTRSNRSKGAAGRIAWGAARSMRMGFDVGEAVP